MGEANMAPTETAPTIPNSKNRLRFPPPRVTFKPSTQSETETPPMTTTRHVTIQGDSFEITAPYAEGHTVTEAEAKALNQLRAENIRNNVASRIRKAEEKGEALDKTALVADYDSTYEFTLSTASAGGSRTLDPVEREARRIAREVIHAKIKEGGFAVKTYREENPEKYESLIEQVASAEETVKRAKKAVDEKNKLASATDSITI